MLRAAVCTICIYVLIGECPAECLVLLTANVDDIKKIAQKFLTEAVSEQIADFLTKAKSRDALSEENERNALMEDRNSREIIENAGSYNKGQKPEKSFKFDFANLLNNIKIQTETKPHEKMHKKAKNKNTYKIPINFTFNYDDYKPNGANSVRNPNRYHKQKKIARIGPSDDNEMQIFNYYNLKKRLSTTTEKQRNEFDQYDFTVNKEPPRVAAFNWA